MNTNTLVASPNIGGNIGSCQINSTDSSVDAIHTMTIAINSCNGEIVNQSVHLDITIVIVIIIVSIFTLIPVIAHWATNR